MGLFKKISKAFRKIVNVATGGLIGHDSSSQQTAERAAPELGFVDADTTVITESEKQQLTKGKRRGKKSLKVNMVGPSSGRNIV